MREKLGRNLDAEELLEALGEWNSTGNLKKLAAALAILAMIAFFVLPGLLQESQKISVSVKNAYSGEPIEGANVLLVKNGAVVGLKHTRALGTVEFNAAPGQGISVKIEAPGFLTREFTGLEEKNEVALSLNIVDAQGGALKQPLQPLTPSFNLAKATQGKNESTTQAVTPRSLEKMEENFFNQTNAAPSPQPTEITQPDCKQISAASATPTASPTTKPSAAPTASPQATASATPLPASTPSATPAPSIAGRELLEEISLNYTQRKPVGSQEIEFYDYAPGGKVRLRVYGNTPAYTVILSQQGNSIEIAAGTLQLVSSDGEPPTAIFRLYASNGTAGSAKNNPASANASGSPAASNGSAGTGSPIPRENAPLQLSISFSSPQANSVISTKTQVSGSAFSSKGIYLVEVSSDGGKTWVKAQGGSSWSAEIDYSQPGPITLKARVTDCAGNKMESEQEVIYGSACKALVYHGPHDKKYDLVLVTSKYGGDLKKFSTDAENALETVFSTAPFNSPELYSKFNVYFYNADAKCEIAGDKAPENRAWKCEVPKEYYESCPFADLAVVFVNSNFRAGKSGNPVVASAGEREIMLHELGHSVFGLADEYCCDGGYWESGTKPNIYQTRDKCEQQTGKGCYELVDKGWSHINIDRGIMNALENKFFDESDLPAFNDFLKKYE